MTAAYWDDGVRREELVRVALGQRPADLVIRGGTLVNVHTGEIYPADVAVAGTRIAAVGDVERCLGDETEVVDAGGRYLVPGLVDCHLHVGATALVMTEFARLTVPLGTAAIVTDFVEPAGLRGTGAMRFFLDEAARTPLKVYLSPFYFWASGEGYGGITEEAFAETLTWPETRELREWDVSSEFSSEQAMGIRARALGLRLCGNLPPMPDSALQGAVASGAHSDHEAETAEQALERVRLGVAVQMRWCSGIRTHMEDVLQAAVRYGCDTRFLMFSSDEVDLDDLADLGHIDHRVRLAIAHGIAPVDAIRMGSLNAATHLGVTGDLGSVAPGRLAFVNLVDDLADFRVSTVVAGSRVVAQDGRFVAELPGEVTYPESYYDTINIGRTLTAADFSVPAPADVARATVRVIGTGGASETRYEELRCELPARDGEILAEPDRDIVKVAVVERQRATGQIGLGFVQGYGLTRGAFGTSYPGDRAVCLLGACDGDLAIVANRIAELGGGFVAALDGRVLAELPLPILGLLASMPAEQAVERYREVRTAIAELGCSLPGLYTTFAFLCLPVSPGLHPSAGGLLQTDIVDDALRFTPVSLVV